MNKLVLIKLLHTLIWIFFNLVIAYLLYAVVIDKIDKWVWLGLGSFAVEGIVLLSFRFICPLTILARKYTDSPKDNFDIYLPVWLAKYTKTIYSAILGIVIIILLYQLSKS